MTARSGELDNRPTATQSRLVVTRNKPPLTLLDATAFLTPVCMFVQIRIIGRLYLSEIMLAGLLLHLLSTRRRTNIPWDPTAKVIVRLALFWLCGQMLSDLIAGTTISDIARGWSKILFTLINFGALYLLFTDNVRRMRLYAAGTAIGALLSYRLVPDLLATNYPWKFGIGLPITLGAVLLASSRLIRALPAAPSALLAFFAALNFLRGFRSLGGICAIAAVVALWQRPARRSRPVRLSPFRVAILSVLGLCTVMLTIEMYARAAESGLLGPTESAKYAAQSGRLGVVLGGRSELFFSTQAIVESPVLGHGSWSKAPAGDTALARLKRFGYRGSAIALTDEVSAHSYVLGAWLEAGIAGAAFWIFILYCSLTALLYMYRSRSALGILPIFAALSLSWDILFSPYGAQGRLIAPFYIVLILYVLRMARSGSVVASGAGLFQATAVKSDAP